MMVTLDANLRGIVKEFHIEYLKKSRGKITAISKWQPELSHEAKQYNVPVELYNEQKEMVAKATAVWHISPAQKKVKT